eukprot:gb/GEZN01003114.1/.p1 GENE.gb/GEZN01003114.1/~~gb/GEZN01003114.1/.p1  ORF type:complete len:628 (+),score=80.67 gb/GEZN01003114.1/:29-1912(+)
MSKEVSVKPVQTYADWIAATLVKAGVTHVYGGHGGAIVPVVDAIHAHPDITWVYARNEASAALMACAHAKLTGRLACCLATSGPGATNLTTGLIEAAKDRLRVICITGMQPTNKIGHAEFQDAYQARLFAGGGLSFSKPVWSGAELVPMFRDAVAVAVRERTVAHLSIPLDVQSMECLHVCKFPLDTMLHKIFHTKSHIFPGQLDKVAGLLVNGAKHRRVLICVGQPGLSAGSGVLALAQALHAPVITRLDAAGVIDQHHPLSMGVFGVHGKPGMRAATLIIETADLVLCIGVEDKTLVICDDKGVQIRRMIEMQDDPCMLDKRFASEEVIVGDLKYACHELAFRVSSLVPVSIRPAEVLEVLKVGPTKLDFDRHHVDDLWKALHRGAWRQLSLLQRSQRFDLYDEDYKSESLAHPGKVLHVVSKFMNQGGCGNDAADELWNQAVLCIDTGDITLWASLCITLTRRHRCLTSEHFGTMGYGLCAGIAAVITRPGPAAALVVVGDGGFQMTLQECATFMQHKRPGDRLVVVVLDNGRLGRVEFGCQIGTHIPWGCEILGPDVAKLAEAYGAYGLRLNKTADASRIFKQAFQNEGLTLVHVMIDPTIKADMAKFNDSAVPLAMAHQSKL